MKEGKNAPESNILDICDVVIEIRFIHLSQFLTLLAHLSSYCDHSPSVGVYPSVCPTSVCPSVHNFLVNTLASTNINQSPPNLVRMYMTIRSRISSIMEVIRPELSELSALELENLLYLTLLTL